MNVGEIVVKRRAELGLSRAATAKLAGVDPKTLQSLERDERWPHDTNRVKIERALQWAPGSLDALRDGGEPTELQQPAAAPAVDKRPPRVDSTAEEAARGVTELRQSIRDLDHLPAYVQRVVLDRAVKELPRAIAALDAERREMLVRYAFRLWDETAGGNARVDGADLLPGADSAGSAAGTASAGAMSHQHDDAPTAGDSTSAPDTDSRDGVSGADRIGGGVGRGPSGLMGA